MNQMLELKKNAVGEMKYDVMDPQLDIIQTRK